MHREFHAATASRPENVGILAMDMYFPRTYVEQVLLLLCLLAVYTAASTTLPTVV